MTAAGIHHRAESLHGISVVSMAVNLPGPLAAARLRALGAAITKVEPPNGDPAAAISHDWYLDLIAGQHVVTLDLKSPCDRERLDEFLDHADLLLTASRPAALARLGLSWQELHATFPLLCQVAIVGYGRGKEHVPGHDLTYQAGTGVLTPPHLPRVLVADVAGAERAATEAAALLFARARGYGSGYVQVSLAQVAEDFAESFRRGVTRPGGVLGGGRPGYRIYRCLEGYLAVAAIEPHFWRRLLNQLGVDDQDESVEASLVAVFKTQTSGYWEQWAIERDLPLAALRTL
ncbi:MAG: CoA transferase [Acidimicrobiales bacterium]